MRPRPELDTRLSNGTKSWGALSRSKVASWLVKRRFVLAVGLLAAVPVLVSTVHALSAGWAPLFDEAIIATNSFDVLTAQSRPVGVYSDASVPDVGPIYNLGPLLFWLLALPTRVPGDWALPVTAALVNTAAIMGVVALARRRGGPIFMVATAIAVVLMCTSLPSGTLHAVLNPSIALLPLTLLLFLAWSVACGEHRLLPLTVLVASFVIQAHVSVAIPAVSALLVALIGLALFAHRTRRDERERSDLRRWLLAALAVALVCWIVPLADEVVDPPGNVSQILDTASSSQETLGLDRGWNTLVRATGAWPWWLREAPSDPGRLFEVYGAPGAATIVSCVLLLGGLIIVGLLGLRRPRADVTAAAALALVVNVAILVGTSNTPERLGIFSLKATLWTSPAGMFSWLILGWSVITLVPARSLAGRAARSPALVRRRAPASVLGLGAVALVATIASTNQEPSHFESIYRPVRSLAAQVNQRLPEKSTVQVLSAERSSGGVRGYALTTGLIYRLRQEGHHPIAPTKKFAAQFGPYYSADEHRAKDLLVIDERHHPTMPGARVLARIPLAATRPGSATLTPRPITASIAPIVACPPPTPSASTRTRSARGLREVPGWVRGTVDASQVVGRRATFCGWAASARSHRAADAVALFANGRFVAAVRPSIARPDVLRALPALGEERLGYSLHVPLSALDRAGRKTKVRLYAIQAGKATPLSFDCTRNPQDFGC